MRREGFSHHPEEFAASRPERETGPIGPGIESMYRLPGDEPLTPRDLERYAEGRKKVDAVLPEILTRHLGDPRLGEALSAVPFVSQVPEADRGELLRVMAGTVSRALDGEASWMRERAIKYLPQLPEAERAPFQEKMLATTHLAFRKGEKAVIRGGMLPYISAMPEKEQAGLWKEAADAIEADLSSKKATATQTEITMKQIPSLPEAEQARLWNAALPSLKKWLESPDASDNLRAMWSVPEAGKVLGDDVWYIAAAFIERSLGANEPKASSTAARAIEHLPETMQPYLIGLALKHPVAASRKAALAMLGKMSDDETRSGFVHDATLTAERLLAERSPHAEDYLFALLPSLPQEEQTRLLPDTIAAIDRLLEEGKEASFDAIIALIPSLPASEQGPLWGDVVATIEHRLDGPNPYDKERALKDIVKLPLSAVGVEERVRLVEKGLTNDNKALRSVALGTVGHLSEEERRAIIAAQPDVFAPLQDAASRTPLYGNHPRKFFSADFAKSGSETTLLDIVPGRPEESLRDRVIIRHLETERFLAWRKAFEAAALWKEKGFDYVPVEPIVGATPTKEGKKVDAVTRVVRGPSLRDWSSQSQLYKEEADTIKKRIMEGLEELGVLHGHAHDANFLLAFEEDGAGEPDLAKPPRVYVIDFDQAMLTDPLKR